MDHLKALILLIPCLTVLGAGACRGPAQLPSASGVFGELPKEAAEARPAIARGTTCIAFDLSLSRSGFAEARQGPLKSWYFSQILGLERVKVLSRRERQAVLSKAGIILGRRINQRAADGMVPHTGLTCHITAFLMARGGSDKLLAGVVLDNTAPRTEWVSLQKAETGDDDGAIRRTFSTLIAGIDDPANDSVMIPRR